MPVRHRLTGPAALAALAALALSAVPAAAAPTAVSRDGAAGPDCAQVGRDDERRDVTGVNGADVALDVPGADALLARDTGRRPGQGVSVVVVDTPTGPLAPGAPTDLPSAHGLTLASIVAGPDQRDPAVAVGIAPAARLEVRPFYTVPRGGGGGGGEGVVEPTAAGLARTLDDVAADVAAGRLGRRVIVLVASEVEGSSPLRAAVRRLTAAGALLVAASGDRPPEGDFLGGFAAGPRPGEDAGGAVWPAADPATLAVGVSTPDAPVALRSSAVDVGAPGVGSVARGLDGGFCVVGEVSTHWAAAQVAGAAALVWSYHDGDDAAALRRRLEATAAGSAGASSRSFGFGEVQPVEAIERLDDALTADARSREPVRRAEAPRERAERSAGLGDDAVWWGLGGVGALSVLSLLRPVLARRPRG